jgi:hypothetical protein
MPGGQHDSSITRVAPVFDKLMKRGDAWPRALLGLAQYGSPDPDVRSDLDLAVQEGFWGTREKPLDPPVALLSWLIRNPQGTMPPGEQSGPRQDLLRRNPQAVATALHALRNGYTERGWFIFEGRTVPDAYIVTTDALIVIEGKRTESAPTTYTKWMPGRHQIWRHIDAAWEIRGNRQVYGLFIVDGPGPDVPEIWRTAARATLLPPTLEASFPHRSAMETAEIARCFLGVTTWRQVCAKFEFSYDALPDTVSEAVALTPP